VCPLEDLPVSSRIILERASSVPSAGSRDGAWIRRPTVSKSKRSCGIIARDYNGDKVATTLIAPDMVRYHASIETQLIYYKHFDKFMLRPSIEVPSPAKLMAVVIDTETGRVCTVYPTDKPKSGSKEYDPNA
jgi:hypothetical protein